jgi:hypothetical protein
VPSAASDGPPPDEASSTAASVPEPIEQSTADLADAVRAYTAVWAAGDPAGAWALVSARCQEIVDSTQFRATVVSAGVLYPDLVAEEIDADEKSGLVSYTVGGGLPDYVDQPWADDGSGWRWDAC